MLSCREIHVFIGHGLWQALKVLLGSAVVLSYAWQCTVLTKAKLGKVYLQIIGRAWTSVNYGQDPISSLLDKLAQ